MYPFALIIIRVLAPRLARSALQGHCFSEEKSCDAQNVMDEVVAGGAFATGLFLVVGHITPLEMVAIDDSIQRGVTEGLTILLGLVVMLSAFPLKNLFRWLRMLGTK